jgi:hypothetical protein
MTIALTDDDLLRLASVFNGVLHDPRIAVTGNYLADEVWAHVAELNEGAADIVAMYDQGEIAKGPDDDATMGEMAEEPYRMADLVEKLRQMTDAEAMAAWVRVKEILRY